jgi:hypothetical protein
MVTLGEIESNYRTIIEAAIGDKQPTAQLLVELSIKLYADFKVEGIGDDGDNDMLLFQYGVYDWGDENGRNFSLDITRQFMLPSTYEPYQLSFSQIFAPVPFENIRSYDCWYPDYGDLESFVSHTKTTEGFKAAENNAPKAYNIRFSQC